ncbi:unnamed protein product [Ambrosiozyma monospora]|uniref:Unnamed protein product n=1 Tax=Ambrosiozyma monospora TaxID=43982 RepID=A0ACB5T2A7_AMBMO|nr:unnamed protein product [Ambrosiozyma monospora]
MIFKLNCKEGCLVLSKYAAIVIFCVVLGRELDLDSLPSGPEPNMPDINIETIVPAGSKGGIKFADDVQVLDVKRVARPELNHVKFEKVVYCGSQKIRGGLSDDAVKDNTSKHVFLKEEAPDEFPEDDIFSDDEYASKL